MGLKVYKDLFGANIKLYVTQETSLHKQMPQILKENILRIMAGKCR